MGEHESILNVDKFLREEHRRYKGSEYEAYVIEAGMNSLGQSGMADVLKYRIINDRFEPRLQIIDNGKGMNSKEFDEYHNFYSETSKNTIGDINFLGMGAKVMIQRVHHIITETKTNNSHLESRWYYNPEKRKAPWVDVYDIKSDIQTKTGTCITQFLKEKEDMEKNNEQHVTELIQREMMGVLLGEYGERKILIDTGHGTMEKQVLSKYPHPKDYPAEKHMIRTIDKLGDFDGGHYPPKCMFCYSPEPFPDGECGLWIIVGKKTIQCQDDWFRAFPKDGMHQHIRGYVIADYLVDIVNDGKNGFDTSKKKWKEFYDATANEWRKFLERIGAEIEKPIVDEDTLKISEKVAKEFDDNLKNWDLIDLSGGKQGQKEKPLIPPLPQAQCPSCGSPKHTTCEDDEGMWLCLDCGTRFPKKWHGHRKGTKKRGGMRFSYWDNVQGEYKFKPSWWDRDEKAIAINTELSTWKYAEGKPKVSEFYHKEFGLRALIEESTITIQPEQREEVFFKYFNDFIKE